MSASGFIVSDKTVQTFDIRDGSLVKIGEDIAGDHLVIEVLVERV
ncbi:MAG: hypothetical protein ACYDCD_01105 [Candidatus Acidiferrales bacterium]